MVRHAASPAMVRHAASPAMVRLAASPPMVRLAASPPMVRLATSPPMVRHAASPPMVPAASPSMSPCRVVVKRLALVSQEEATNEADATDDPAPPCRLSNISGPPAASALVMHIPVTSTCITCTMYRRQYYIYFKKSQLLHVLSSILYFLKKSMKNYQSLSYFFL
jgi:hypothetical protein